MPVLKIRVLTTPEAVELEDKEEAARIRLDADVQRFNELVRANFSGPKWDQFCDDLWVYGWAVLDSGLRTGSIFWWCWKANVIVKTDIDQRRVLEYSKEDRDELVFGMISKAIPDFRSKILLKGRWRASKGASLRTFFIGYCLQKLSSGVRLWQRKRDRWLMGLGYPAASLDLTEELADSYAADPQEKVEMTELFDVILRKASPETRLACFLTLQGHTQAEIANELGTTARTVEGQMARLRKRARTMVERGQVTMPSFLVGIAP